MEKQPQRIFVTDCEGPITQNDNAAELSEAFIPKGDRFFSKISLYDDYLAEVVRRPGYKAGDTLRLILPFFKAFGLDNRTMERFSRRNVRIIPEADRMLRELLEIIPAFMVSTSYSPYIRAVCDTLGFPYPRTYSTAVDLDRYPLEENERNTLKQIHSQILELPDFSIPRGAGSIKDIPEEGRTAVEQLDRIFWTDLPNMEINQVIADVNPVGGREKAAAIKDIAEAQGVDLSDIMYVGDSITDVDAFRMLKSAGGLTVCFNGNDWAVKEAAFAVTCHNALPIGWIANLFLTQGLRGFEDLTLSRVTPENRERISALSCQVRKTVRTDKIGCLG